MRTRKFGLLALVLGATMFGAACEDKSEVIVPPPATVITLNIAPDPVPTLNVGQTVQLVSIVSGSATQTATWTSSNTAVAEVNTTTGLVTAKAAGVAVITAVSTVDATARDAVTIQVQAAVPPPPPGQVTISIQTINDNDNNQPVNPGDVEGVVNVIANVDVPANTSLSAIRVMVVPATGAAVEVCRQTFAGGSQVEDAVSASAIPVPVNCSINTALLQNGTPRFPNGTYTIRVEALDPAGAVIASATSQPLVFNNVNALNVTAAADGATATDAAGLSWTTGNLTVTVTPAIFTGTGNTVASGTVTVRDANTAAIIAQAPLGTANTAGTFSVTFTKAANTTNGLLDVSEAESPITVEVSTITTTGNQGTGFGPAQVGANPLRLDNQAPDDTNADATVAAFNNPGWFSTTTSLTGTNRVTNLAELSDEGVNRNTVTLQYNTNAAATNSSSGWTSFTDVSVLPETTTSTQIAFRAVVCDQLNNCVNVGPVTAGVDLSAPTVTILSGPSNNAVNPATELQVVGTDVISGTSIVRVRVSGRSVFEIDTNADTDLRCYDASGVLLATGGTNPTSGTCATADIATVGGPGASENQQTVVIPADENWYTIEIQTRDVAGNLSTTTLTRNYLVDAEVPTASIASTTITGTTASISGTVQDNIQVRAYDSRFRFVGITTPDEIPFSAPTTVDETLDNTLTGTVSASATSTLTVRSLQEASGDPDAGTYALAGAVTPTVFGFGVFDMANLFGFNGSAIAFGAGDGVENVANVDLTASPATICRTGTSSCPTSSTFTVEVETTVPGSPTTPFNNPIARVYFYYTNPGSDATFGTADDYLVLLGSQDAAAATFTTSATTGVRVFNFTGSITSALPTMPTATPFPVHAIAVDPEGDAIMVSRTVTVNN